MNGPERIAGRSAARQINASSEFVEHAIALHLRRRRFDVIERRDLDQASARSPS